MQNSKPDRNRANQLRIVTGPASYFSHFKTNHFHDRMNMLWAHYPMEGE